MLLKLILKLIQNEKFIKILKISFYCSLLSTLLIFINNNFYKDFGNFAFYILIVIMFSRPLRDIFPKQLFILDKIVRIRKELGIIVGFFAIAHVIGYFLNIENNLFIFLNKSLWYLGSYLMWGFLAFIVTIPLLLTSNYLSVKKLGKYWKKLQYLSYLMFIFTILHIALIKKDDFFSLILLLIFYLIILFLSFYLNNKRNKNSKSTRYICIPCSWIYDEAIGDPDGGIPPGTKFEDIPDDWVCPVCGVGKKDFKKLGTVDEKEEFFETKVVEKNFLNKNKDVIELVIEYKDDLKPEIGQFVSFVLSDIDGDFKRSYSISQIDGNKYYFLIKILEDGKAGKIFKNIKINDKITTTKAYGNFILNKNNNKKLFIATGTGLAPIYFMLSSLPKEENKTLLYGSQDLNDVCYIEKLQQIKNLDLYIYLSREEKIDNHIINNKNSIKYIRSRIDLNNFEDIDSFDDFYLCGNNKMIQSSSDFLTKLGKTNIYFEKFDI